MIALISPAKTLDYRKPLPEHMAELAPTRPRFSEEASALAGAAARLSRPRLEALMRISPKLAALNVARFRDFAEAPERPAIHAFAGDVYTGFEARTLDAPAVRFAQDHLRILSGLYGLLRPLDAMRPYRLEMGTKWAPGRARDLYAFWGARIADQVLADLAESGGDAIVNLASQEYWAAAGPHLGDARVIEIDFRDAHPDGPRFVSFNAKKARGIMARYMCEHAITDPEALKGFDSDGYAFDREGSDERRWRFVRGLA